MAANSPASLIGALLTSDTAQPRTPTGALPTGTQVLSPNRDRFKLVKLGGRLPGLGRKDKFAAFGRSRSGASLSVAQ